MLSRHGVAGTAVLVLALAVTSLWAGPPVAIVLKNGQRYSGTLAAQRGDRVYLQIDSRQRNWSQNDIAVIEFVPGQANQRELSALASVPAQIAGAASAAVRRFAPFPRWPRPKHRWHRRVPARRDWLDGRRSGAGRWRR